MSQSETLAALVMGEEGEQGTSAKVRRSIGQAVDEPDIDKVSKMNSDHGSGADESWKLSVVALLVDLLSGGGGDCGNS